MEIVEVDQEYKEKMLSYEIDCNNGKGLPSACHSLAEYYGLILQNNTRAAELYKKNCDDFKFSGSCLNYAKYLMAGRGVEEDLPGGVNYLKRACEYNNQPACYQYGAWLYSSAVEELALRSIQIPSNKTKDKLHRIDMSDMPIDDVKAQFVSGIDVLVKSCMKGESNSCYLASGHFLDTNSPARNPKIAKQMLEKACDSNNAQACYNLAVLYRRGDEGIPKDNALFEKYKKLYFELEEIQNPNVTELKK